MTFIECQQNAIPFVLNLDHVVGWKPSPTDPTTTLIITVSGDKYIDSREYTEFSKYIQNSFSSGVKYVK